MDGREKPTDIEKLTQILAKVQNLYYKKEEQLEELQLELKELKDSINLLSTMITTRSFSSADEIFIQTVKNPEKFFTEKIPKDIVKDTNIKSKIYSSESDENSELLAVLNFKDLDELIVKIINPQKLLITETLEDFLTIFLKGALVKIKNQNPELDLKYIYYKNTEIIEFLIISHIANFEEYDLITNKITELLLKRYNSLSDEG
ncbi:MAG: hypothetical protein ACTSR8_20105 [Promethearchaeota archaeon]